MTLWLDLIALLTWNKKLYNILIINNKFFAANIREKNI